MKINVNITVDIDPAAWSSTFGVEGAAEIRADVKSYVGNGVASYGAFGNGEVSAEVTWK